MTVPSVNLMELIRQTKAGRSYETLEAESGGSPSRQRWQQIATKMQAEFPNPETIRTMARVLGVGETTVVLAAAGSVGLEVEAGTALGALLPPSVDRLTERQIGAVVTVIRAMLEPGDPAPRTTVAANARERLARAQEATGKSQQGARRVRSVTDET